MKGRHFNRRERVLFWFLAGLIISGLLIKGLYAPFLRRSRLAAEKHGILDRKVRRWEKEIAMSGDIQKKFPQWVGWYVMTGQSSFVEETQKLIQEGLRRSGLALQHIDVEPQTNDYFSRISIRMQLKGDLLPMAKFFAFIRTEAPFLEIKDIKFSRPSYAQETLLCEIRVDRTFLDLTGEGA